MKCSSMHVSFRMSSALQLTRGVAIPFALIPLTMDRPSHCTCWQWFHFKGCWNILLEMRTTTALTAIYIFLLSTVNGASLTLMSLFIKLLGVFKIFHLLSSSIKWPQVYRKTALHFVALSNSKHYSFANHSINLYPTHS